MNATTTTTAEQSTLAVLPPSGYKALCVTNLLLCSVSSIVCVVLIAAMVLPLLYPKRRKDYSTYNLYLAYLAVPDLAANAFIVYLVLAHKNWIPSEINNNSETENDLLWMFDHPLDHSIYILTVTSNMYLNAFLTHEIFRLLKNSNMRRRHYPPTIATVSYGFGTLVFLVHYGIGDRFESSSLYKILMLVYCAFIPLTVLIVLCAMIYWQELVQSTGPLYEGRLKVLILYFARIIFTDILFWLPASIIYFVSWSEEEVNRTKIIAYNICILFSGSQSIVNFGCSLTKPDAWKLIVDLLKCVYCRKCGGNNNYDVERDASRTLPTTNEFRCRDPYLRAIHRRTILFSKPGEQQQQQHSPDQRPSTASATERASQFSQKFLPGKDIALDETSDDDNTNTKCHVDVDVVADDEPPRLPSGP